MEVCWGFVGGLQLSIKVLNQTGYAVYTVVIQSFWTAYVKFRTQAAKRSMNSTANGSSESWSCFDQLNSIASRIRVTVTYCLIFIVSLVANSLIVMIVYKMPNLKKPINYFIVNMALSDLLSAIFWVPLNLSIVHTNSVLNGGQLGQAFCKLVFFFGNVSIAVSTENLILIAVDRFGAVVFPLRSPLIRSKLCPFFILATWIVAVAGSSPYLFVSELDEFPDGSSCVMKWRKVFGESSSYASFLLPKTILFMYIPVLFLVIIYSIIVIKLNTQRHPGEQSANTQQRRNRRNINVLQMSIAIVTVFGLCFLPYSINCLITEYKASSTHFSCSFWLFLIATIDMANAYCAINPVICFIFSSNYRKALKRIIKCSSVQV